MTTAKDNILERAKAAAEKFKSRDESVNHVFWGYRAAEELLPELIAEVERLRSLTLDQQYMMDDLDKEIAAKDVRIKELEAELEDLGRDFAIQVGYAERLEAAFLEAKSDMIYFQDAPNREAELIELYDEAEHKAREALERIKEGGKDED